MLAAHGGSCLADVDRWDARTPWPTVEGHELRRVPDGGRLSQHGLKGRAGPATAGGAQGWRC
jgi:hypothetical protein